MKLVRVTKRITFIHILGCAFIIYIHGWFLEQARYIESLTQVSLSRRRYFFLSRNPPICCGAETRYEPLRTSAWEAIVKCSYGVSKHLSRLRFVALSMQKIKCLSHMINPLFTTLFLTMTSSSLSIKTQERCYLIFNN